ncbi:MAG: tRNA (adenosine(37)-N6)-threonylcarbamoyltransferase complex dimerization subunit type 1 TsaB [Rhodobacteraceae bacterium]|nr:tRNA (adenosine(37)-N6)-threonylcarbamoyltransferase complex dimerization subunit type 1 TsaB [Paracoccaceae bacterium]
MQPEPLVLAFDTSAAHCAAALLSGDKVLSHAHEEMAKGQAERLFPLLQEVLEAAGRSWQDLSAIGVCTGPGNFTGVRISVASARGLALSLQIPAIGVSILEALAFGQPGKSVSLLDARHGRVFWQRFQDGKPESDPGILAMEDLDTELTGAVQINCREPLPLPGTIAITCLAPDAPVTAVARIALQRLGQDNPRPAPLYLRPANASLPADPAPVILP